MRKWIWTFGGETIYRNKYIVVYCDKGDGRDILFEIYGRENFSMSYLEQFELEKETGLRHKGYTQIAEWTITDKAISVDVYHYVDCGRLDKETITQQGDTLSYDFIHKVWETMIGGV